MGLSIAKLLIGRREYISLFTISCNVQICFLAMFVGDANILLLAHLYFMTYVREGVTRAD